MKTLERGPGNPAFRFLMRQTAPRLFGRSQDDGPLPYLAAPDRTSDRPVTIDDIVVRSVIVLTVLVAVAALTVLLGLEVLALPGALAGLGIGLYLVFRPRASAVLALGYAAAEGLVIGGAVQASPEYAGQAAVATAGVFLGMLLVYRSRRLRLGTTFTRWVMGAGAGLLVLTLLDLVAGVGLRGGGILGFAFGLACACVASLTFLTNFEVASDMIRKGASSGWSWYVAFGLTLAVVWLYLEVLRLLSFRFR